MKNEIIFLTLASLATIASFALEFETRADMEVRFRQFSGTETRRPRKETDEVIELPVIFESPPRLQFFVKGPDHGWSGPFLISNQISNIKKQNEGSPALWAVRNFIPLRVVNSRT